MHIQEFPVTRRHAIAGAGVVAAAAALTACSTYGNDPATEQPASPQASGDGAPPGALAATSDIPVGSGSIFDDVVVTQPTSGDFRGLSPICTHQGCRVSSIVDGEIVCPCHGSKFALDGAVVAGPARNALPAVAITVEGDSIMLG